MLVHKRYIASLVLLVLYLPIFSQTAGSLIRFTENKHQWQDFILYRAQLDGGALYAEKNALTYSFYDKETLRSLHASPRAKLFKDLKTTGFKVLFNNCNDNALVESTNPYKDYFNYFIGNDKSRWASNVKNYQKLFYTDLWHNINLEILGQDNSIKYNFYVKPGGDAENIQLHYDKTEKISLERKQLIIKTSLNELVEHEPYAYQIINDETVTVPCYFKLKHHTVSFSFPKGYNRNYELVIDPVLVFACTSGSTTDNFGFTATYDPQGNLYSGGIAFNTGYPVVNAYDSTYNGTAFGSINVVITKYDSSGTFLHYSTYMGGSMDSQTITSLIVDAQNDLYFYGATGASDFPITSHAYDNSFNGGNQVTFSGSGTQFVNGSDLYVAKLSAGGNQLLASTFIGGSDNDGLNLQDPPDGNGGEGASDSMQYNYGDQYRGEIDLDNMGNPVITSCSRSADFPTKNAIDKTLGGWQDAVVFKFDPNLSQLQWSTYLGGSGNDGGYGLVIGKNNEVYTTGGTRSKDFPVTKTALDTSYNGGMCDGYVTKISAGGDSLLAATYIGTPDYDQSFFVQLDKAQNVYIYGQSKGIMPVISSLYSDSNSAQFVTKLNNNLSKTIYQTVVGNKNGRVNISPTAFLVDYCENVYISGWGGDLRDKDSTLHMPITNPTIQATNDGFNFYMMQLSKDCNLLLFATYYGGNLSKEHVHGGTSRYDKRGIVYQALCSSCLSGSSTVHQDFPLYPANAWPGTPGHPNHNTDNDNCTEATFKIDFKTPLVIANYNANKYGCAPLKVSFTNQSTNATSYLWNFGNKDTTSLANPVRTYTTPGTYTATLIATNLTACNGSDTTIITIIVKPSPQTAFTVAYDSCANSVVLQNTSAFPGGTLLYNWNFGNGQISTNQSPDTIVYKPGSYTASLIAIGSNGCNDTTRQPLNFTINPMQAYPDAILCLKDSLHLYASGGLSYTWQPAAGLSSITSSNPMASPAASTIYTVNIAQTDGGGRACLFMLTDTITIHPSVTAVFSYSKNACQNTFTFKDSSYTNVTSWQWSFGDSLVDSIRNPIHSYQKPGTYTISLLANNQYNCPGIVQEVIKIGGFTPISISKNTLVCRGKTVQLMASGGISYTWAPSYNLNADSIYNPVATPTSTTHYTLYLTQTDSLGDICSSVLHTNITIPFYTQAQLIAHATPDTIVEGGSSQLSTSLNSGYIIWNPDYNLSSDSSLDPTASPHHTTTYTASYIDPHGCVFPVSSITIYVIAPDCNENTVFVPNTFTPNADGRNDILYARSAFVTELYFTVYDRWGQQVFATNDINKGWDGIFNGKPCNPDVFGYYLTFKCNDGRESFKKGNVTLIR